MSSGNSTVTDGLPTTSETTTEAPISTTTTTIISTTLSESTTSEAETTSTTESEPEPTPTATSTSTTPTITTSESSTIPQTTTTSANTETIDTSTIDPTTVTVTITSTGTLPPSNTSATSSTTSATTTTLAPGETGGSNSGDKVGSGFSKPAVIAVSVIVPVVIIAIVGVVLLLYFKKRRNKRDAPSKGFISGGMMGGGAPPPDGGRDGTFEMNETDSAGYRGWGSTAGGRKTTMASSSGYPISSVGKAVSDGGYSNSTSVGPPGYPGNVKEMYGGMNVPTSPGYPDSTGLLAVDRTAPSPAFTESSTIGAMPTFDSHNSGGLNRGISNASSNYSAMSHSDQSDYDHRQSQRYYGPDAQDYDAAYFSNGPNMYYDDSSNPPPVIRDVQARRNTRIETPTSAHFPQQGSSGIAQNF